MSTTPDCPRAVPSPTLRRLTPAIPRPRAATPVHPAVVAKPVVSIERRSDVTGLHAELARPHS